MAINNSSSTYGSVSRVLHWLTALLILTAIALGLNAQSLPFDTGEALARKAAVFSLHKTVGVAVFIVAVARILWALTQTHPAPVNPGRRLETAAAAFVHWSLYVALVAVPLSGWIEHAATEGFAPILWPLGQGLPFVPASETVAHTAAQVHVVFTKLLFASLFLHVAGAVKHALIDRDGVLSRMVTGAPAPANPRPAHSRWPAVAAVALWAVGLAAVLVQSQSHTPAIAAPAVVPPPAGAVAAGNWQVAQGDLTFSVRQMGAQVQGRIASWQAEIAFDDKVTDGPAGQVGVTMDMASLTLASVTQQAQGPEFLDVPAHPTARFAGPIRRTADGWVVDGTLTLHGVDVPVTLPFTLAIEGDTATMQGGTTLERLAYGIGPKYPDGSTVGLTIDVSVALTATRVK